MNKKHLKCTPENIEKLCNILHMQMEDENGRGEFDVEVDLLTACEHVIAWIEDDRE